MIINLGLVELGGDPIDIPDVHGYIFKFAEDDPSASQIRAYYALRRLLASFNDEAIDLRVFINYDSQECLAVATKLLVEHKYICKSIVILFESGNVLRIK